MVRCSAPIAIATALGAATAAGDVVTDLSPRPVAPDVRLTGMAVESDASQERPGSSRTSRDATRIPEPGSLVLLLSAGSAGFLYRAVPRMARASR